MSETAKVEKTSTEILSELFSSIAPKSEDGEAEEGEANSASSPSGSEEKIHKKAKKAKKEKKKKKKKDKARDKEKGEKKRKSSPHKRKARPLSPPPRAGGGLHPGILNLLSERNLITHNISQVLEDCWVDGTLPPRPGESPELLRGLLPGACNCPLLQIAE